MKTTSSSLPSAVSLDLALFFLLWMLLNLTIKGADMFHCGPVSGTWMADYTHGGDLRLHDCGWNNTHN